MLNYDNDGEIYAAARRRLQVVSAKLGESGNAVTLCLSICQLTLK